MISDPLPAYHFTIVNHGTRDVMMIAFKSYRGTALGWQGRPRGTGHVPLIRSGESYVLNGLTMGTSRSESRKAEAMRKAREQGFKGA